MTGFYTIEIRGSWQDVEYSISYSTVKGHHVKINEEKTLKIKGLYKLDPGFP